MTTLRRFPDSVLFEMVEFSQNWNDGALSAETDSSSAFFVDRDPDLFAAILRYHDMVEFDLETLCNDRSGIGLPVTRKLLAQEAEYYNLQSLMDSVSSAIITPPSPPIKYILYVIRKQYGSFTKYKFDVPKAAEKSYTNKFSLQGLHGCEEGFLSQIQSILAELNQSGGSAGFQWTMWAITSLGSGGMELVIRGDKQQ